MSKKVGNQTIVFENKPAVKGFYTIAGFKEGEGNFKDYFDMILENDKFVIVKKQKISEKKVDMPQTYVII